ncbi:MAG TPA: hypothetical protein VKU19_16800 [Bryobacteraceae bacterium]|nr:hypothetical protein [Bryobacteraceae bacterium]
MRGSESLCRLLRYLANRAIQEPGIPIREHEIAVEVFGRTGAFDPRIDSTVRVNIARLRAKLIEYYNGPGGKDQIAIELPKGSYTLAFSPKCQEVEPPKITVRSVIETPAIRVEPPRSNRSLLIAFVCMTAITATLAATLLLERNPRRETRAAVDTGDTHSLRRFWSVLLNGPNDPLVVFSNATFVGKPATGMRYFVSSRDAGREVVDFYTGVGEVLSIHALDRTFSLLGRAIRVKRGGLLSLDDMESSDVIFVGSSLENLPLRDVPGLQDFQFRLMESGPRSGQGGLINLSPRDGEPKVFLPSSLPLSEDYAVVGLVPGLNPSRWALILAGTSTIGTQGAVEYVCREDTLHDLLELAGKVKPGSPPRFEAVLDVHIKGGVPVQSKIVAFHERRPRN